MVMRRSLATLLCVIACGLPHLAMADPVTLRHGAPAEGLVVQAGWPDVSAAWWLQPELGVALAWRLPAAAVSASVGTRRRLPLGSGAWSLDGYLAGGLLVPTVDPGLALTATPALQIARRGARGELDLGVAVPLELQVLSERRLRAPVLLELGGGVVLGPAELGLRGGFGPVFTAPGAMGFALQWSLWVRVPRAG
jgi:hypothetical protein